MAFLLGGGWLLGLAIAILLLMTYVSKDYRATAFIRSPEHAGHAAKITDLRARIIVRELDLANRWNTSFEDAVAQVLQAVELKDADKGVEIDVVFRSVHEARAIARWLALYLDTPAHEREMAAKGIVVDDTFASAEVGDYGDVATLEDMLHQQAAEAGFDSFTDVIEKAAQGDEKASTLMKSEDFSRRLVKLQEISVRAGLHNPPGEAWHAPNSQARLGAVTEASAPIKRWLAGCSWGGCALAGLLILALKGRPSSFLRPVPRPQPPPPAPRPPIENDSPW